MPTIGQLVVNLLGNSKPFINEIKNAKASVAGLARDLAAAAAVTASIGAATKAVSLAGDYESTEVAFKVMMKDANAAKKTLEDLAQFAAQTPFQLPEVEDGAKQLLGYGFAAKDLVPTLRMLGDVGSALKIPLNDLIYLYGTSSTQAHIFSKDVQQFAGRGIPIIAELSKVLGVAKSDVMSMVEEGDVGFQHLQQALINMTTAGGQFAGSMAEGSNTLKMKWSNAMDNISLSLRTVGKELVEAFKIKQVIDQAIAATAKLRQFLNEYGQQVGSAIKQAARFGAAVGAVTVAFRGLALAQKSVALAMAVVKSLSGPKGWIELAAGVAIAIGTYRGIESALNGVAQGAQEVAETSKLKVLADDARSAEDAIRGLASATAEAKTGYAAASEELQKHIDSLIHLDKLRDKPNYRRIISDQQFGNMESPSLQSIGDLTAFNSVSKIKPELEAAWKIYNQIAQANAEMSHHQLSLGGIEGEIARLTGGAEELQKIRDQIREIQEGADAVHLDKMIQLGNTPQMIEDMVSSLRELRQLEAEKKNHEESTRSAQQLWEQTRTPQEKYQNELARLDKMRKEGSIDDDLYNRGVEQAKKQMKSGEKKNLEPLNAVEAGSAEAQKIVMRAMNQGSSNPNKGVEKNTAGIQTEIKKTNELLTVMAHGKTTPRKRTIENF